MEREVINNNHKRRKVVLSDSDDGDDIAKARRFKILLPNGTSVELSLRDPKTEMPFGDFIGLVRKKYLEARKLNDSMKKKRDINWEGDALFLQDATDAKIRNVIKFKSYNPHKCHILRLLDGSSDVAKTFENMWDLTPDTDLLLELPEEYTFETALADLIDNSLQAVWSNGENNSKLIRVNVDKDKISIFDNGPGMDDSDENSIVKWGKMGASLHRSSKSQAIGGKPPYLMPYFGMFGYGAAIASMHLGRRASVSSKTQQVKKVYVLLLEREALLSTSTTNVTWKTRGAIRNPLKDELSVSHGSFTKVVIYEPKVKDVDINKLQCRLKDIYFPYIQCDDLSDSGKTITPVEFQVNGVNLTEIQGGEVAITNLHSCNGPEFVLQLHLSLLPDHGSKEFKKANARLRVVYFPFAEGKENIERVLEKLMADGCVVRENFQSFNRVSVRRLGRLLPEARWTLLPFMDFRNKKGNKANILKRCSSRVKCFIETDAGFKPTQSKTDLAHHNPFTVALKNLGNKISDKEKNVIVEIRKATKLLTPLQLEKEYQDWILEMHRQYDEEADSGEDQPVIIVSPANKKALGISSDVVRVHRVLRRKDKCWKHGQRIKVLKGACAGCHKTNVYATLEYFLLEGFGGDAGGEARIICRPIDIPDENGCSLSVSDKGASLNIGGSLSLPISVIDYGKLVAVESIEWDNRLYKRQQKSPSSIDSPSPNHYKRLEVDGDAKVTSNELDKIRPSYKTNLIVASNNVPMSLSVPCRGFLKHVQLKPKITEDELFPGFIFKELMLEFFDTYQNHVSEGLEVTIDVAGFEMLNHTSTVYKVNDKGQINLGGLLKLTAGYGEIASISVVFENRTVFKQEFSTVKRILRIASEVPDSCAAGGHLENIDFEIVKPDGDVDTKIHHSDQDHQFHMLTIKSDFFNTEELIRYTFKHGRCTIPSIRVPVIIGTFCFEACHSQYTELCLTVKVQVVKMANVKSVGQPLTLDKSIIPLQELSSFDHENNLMMMSIINNDDKELGDILRLGEKIKKLEKYLVDCHEQKTETDKEMLKLLDKVQLYRLGNLDSLFTKDEMTTKIKSLENSAASVVCNLSTHKKQQNYFIEDIIGVVALLGSVQSPELSRVLAEYLGEDKMLGVICRSFDTASSLERYKQNGEIDCMRALHAEAAALGKAISKRFLVMCFEDLRPYTGFSQEDDSQRKLVLPDPTLPNGRIPAGFMGYAVNMVDLDINHLQTRTALGHGLRETVLFSLFKKLHVYKTRENMMAARACIDHGAVSLDGGIIRENGILSLGDGNPYICFPCLNKMDVSPEAEEILTHIEGMKAYLRKIEENISEVTKRLKKNLKKFERKKERYSRLMDRIEPMTEVLEYKPETGSSQKCPSNTCICFCS